MTMASSAPHPLLLLLFLLFVSMSTAADDALKACLVKTSKDPKIASIVYANTAPNFSRLLTSYIRNRRFNTSSTPKPTTILTPVTSEHVSTAVICAKSLKIHLRIRSGGHDYDGLSYITDNKAPFVILDMFRFNQMEIDIKSETAWVGAGATLGELYYHISEKSKVHGFPAGICPTVAIGGHLSGAGYGTLIRKYGLTVDHVVDAEIVDAKGRILNRKSMGEDLFWAIRGGGGGSFGVVLRFKINLVRVPDVVSYFRVEKYIEEDNATDIFVKWQKIAYNIDRDLFVRVLVQPVTPKTKSVTSNKKNSKTIRLTFMSTFLGNSNKLISITDKEFPELKLKKSDTKEMSWIDSVLAWNSMNSSKELLDRDPEGKHVNFGKRKSDYVQKPMTKQDLMKMWDKMIELGKTGLVFNQYGGRMAEIPVTETPFPHRAGNIFKIQYSQNWQDESVEEKNAQMKQIRDLYAFNKQFVSKNPRGAFVNYRDVDIGVNRHRSKCQSYADGQVYGRKYFKENFDRLVKVKTAVDPDNFFSYEQSIPVKAA